MPNFIEKREEARIELKELQKCRKEGALTLFKLSIHHHSSMKTSALSDQLTHNLVITGWWTGGECWGTSSGPK
jgi:hypothetical protein